MKSIQELADELVDQMFNVDFDEDFSDPESQSMSHLHAIRCAKIAAHMVIQEVDWHESEHPTVEVAKWQCVIEELETKEQKAKQGTDDHS